MKTVIALLIIASGVCAYAEPYFLTLPFDGDRQLVAGWFYSCIDDNCSGDCSNHQGIDYDIGYLEPILAAHDGVAMTSERDPESSYNFGIFVRIRDENGYETMYAHLDHAAPEIRSYPEEERNNNNFGEWTPVGRGDVIGYCGDTGTSPGNYHLHFVVQTSYASGEKDPYGVYCTATHYPGDGLGTDYMWTTFPPSHSQSAFWVDQTPHYPSGLDYYPASPGQILHCTFTFNNGGPAYWTNDPSSPNYVELQSVTGPGSNRPWGDSSPSNLAWNWIDPNRVGIDTPSGQIDPGIQGLFEFDIKAPFSPGDYFLYVAVYRPHSSAFISGTGPTLHIRVESGTYVGGTIGSNTVWTSQNSPYIVTSDIVISYHAELSIQPGVIVKFTDGTGIVVGPPGPYYWCGWSNTNGYIGSLRAEGTPASPIIFTSLSGNYGDWKGIVFDQMSSQNLQDRCNPRIGTSLLTYCIIEKAGASNKYGIGANVYYRGTTKPSIVNCVIRDGSSFGSYFYNASEINIQSSIFTGNGQSDIIIGSSSSLNIENNTFQSGNHYAINCGSYTPRVCNNTFDGGAPRAIKVAANAAISQNTFSSNAGGIEIAGGTVSSNRTWETPLGTNVPYAITGDVAISNNAQLTIQPGITLKFAEGTGMIIGPSSGWHWCSWANTNGWVGSLVANGTPINPIIFTSLSGQLGVWKGLLFDVYSKQNLQDRCNPAIGTSSLSYCVVEKAGRSNSYGAAANIYYRMTDRPDLDHCGIQLSTGCGVYAYQSTGIVISNSSITNNATGVASSGGYVSYTVDARNNWWGDQSGPADPSTGTPDYNPSGTGCSVSDYVTYRPWLNYSPSTQELIDEALAALPEGFSAESQTIGTVNPGGSSFFDILVDNFSQVLRIILNWFGSELQMKIYKPDGALYGQWQSTVPPIEAEIIGPDTGTWRLEVVALDVPYDNYPYAVVVGAMPLGSISCQVNDTAGLAMQSVRVDLYNGANELLECSATDQSGQYHFINLAPGAYDVTIMTPLGYVADAESKFTTVIPGQDSVVYFYLSPLDIRPAQRGLGFWKHQVNVYLNGHGSAQVSLSDLSSYMGLITNHFNGNLENPILIFEVEQPASQVDSLAALQILLTVNNNGTTNDRAKQHLTALLLNVVAGKLSQTDTTFSGDGLTVSQAITYCDQLIADSDSGNDEVAKDIAESINNGISVASGVIPPSTPNISYKGQVLTGILPVHTYISQNYPNPFNSSTIIAFSLSEPSNTIITIYNLLGQKVKTVVEEQLPAGNHIAVWDGRNETGSSVSTGIYLFRIEAGSFSETKKLVLLR